MPVGSNVSASTFANIKIEEAVVERRNQRVGHGMGEAREVGVRTRGINHDEVLPMFDLGDRAGKTRELGVFVLIAARAFSACDAEMKRQFERQTELLRPPAAALDIVRKCPLARIEVDGRDALSRLQKGNSEMHGGRRLARPALLVPKHDDMRRVRLSLDSASTHIAGLRTDRFLF
jgi:hypothetical protein